MSTEVEAPHRPTRAGVVAAAVLVLVLAALVGVLGRSDPPAETDQAATFLERFDEISSRLAATESDVAGMAPDRALGRLDGALGEAIAGYSALEPPPLLGDDVALLLDALRAEQATTAALAAGNVASTSELLERRTAARNLQGAVRRSAVGLVEVGD